MAQPYANYNPQTNPFVQPIGQPAVIQYQLQPMAPLAQVQQVTYAFAQPQISYAMPFQPQNIQIIQQFPDLPPVTILNDSKEDGSDLKTTHQSTLEMMRTAERIKKGFSFDRLKAFIPLLGTLAGAGFKTLNRFSWSRIASNSVIKKISHVGIHKISLHRLGHTRRCLLLGGAASCVGLIASGFFIYNAKKEMDALKKVENEFNEQVETWNGNQSIYTKEYKKAVKEVNKHSYNLLNKMKKDKLSEIALLSLGALGQGCLALGFLGGSPLLLSAGAGIGLVISVSATVKEILDSVSQGKLKENLKTALDIQFDTRPLAE